MRKGKFVPFILLLCLESGCQSVGAIAIDQGRNRYNSIIQSTTKEQTLANIVGARNHEPTAFMDVSEVDATTTFTSTMSGGLTNIGAIAGTKSTSAGTIAGQVGSVAGGVTYTEQPIVRYTPLLGSALVAQLVTPISVEALADLYDSSWPGGVTSLLDLSASYLTLNKFDFFPTLNIIAELDANSALTFVATKSDLTSSPATLSTRAAAAPQSPAGTNSNKPIPNDSLTIYLSPFRVHGPGSSLAKVSRRELQLWIRLLWIYFGTQKSFLPEDPALCAKMRLSASNRGELMDWDTRLDSAGINPDAVIKCLPNSIELRTLPVIPAKLQGLISAAPLLKTFSAVGILRNATQTPGPKIEFVSPEKYHEIASYGWNQDTDSVSYYTLLPKNEDPADNPAPAAFKTEKTKIDWEISDWIARGGNGHGLFTYERKHGISIDDYLALNRRLGSLRRYLLVIIADRPPLDAYVSYFDQGKWYYIESSDKISQRNFTLMSLFLTMMAVPAALPPISPTISVGGG